MPRGRKRSLEQSASGSRDIRSAFNVPRRSVAVSAPSTEVALQHIEAAANLLGSDFPREARELVGVGNDIAAVAADNPPSVLNRSRRRSAAAYGMSAAEAERILYRRVDRRSDEERARSRARFAAASRFAESYVAPRPPSPPEVIEWNARVNGYDYPMVYEPSRYLHRHGAAAA